MVGRSCDQVLQRAYWCGAVWYLVKHRRLLDYSWICPPYGSRTTSELDSYYSGAAVIPNYSYN